MNKPNNFVEVFLSLIKIFLIVLVLNNLIWAGIVHKMVSSASSETVLTQGGENNTQGINNGTIN